ncbi:MAG TPA: hypothetical protein VF070_29470, partial [Streptosporangiaceae bacterium]
DRQRSAASSSDSIGSVMDAPSPVCNTGNQALVITSYKVGPLLSLDHPGVGRVWLLIVLVSVFDSHVRFLSG